MSVSRRTVTPDSPHDAHIRIASLQVCAAAIGLLTILLQGSPSAAATEASDESQISLQSQVLPILKRNCLKCHGVSKKEGQLQLHSAIRIWKGGESGLAVVAANPSQSLLWTHVEQNKMPPEKPLNEQEKRILHDWIAEGAEGLPKSDAEAESMRQDEHWAFTRIHPAEPPAARIAYGIVLHDFDNSSSTPGGNILIDGDPVGGATVHVNYPGPSSTHAGNIGAESYVAGRSFGVRITHLPEHRFRLEHLVDALPEGRHVDLSEKDLPDGSFGFGFCCNRSFQVDDVVIEVSGSGASDSQNGTVVQAWQAELQRRQAEIKAIAEEIPKLQAAEPGRIAWITDSTAAPPEVFLLDRGEYSQPKDQVEPAPISVLNDAQNPMEISLPAGGFQSSGRRLAWARWVTKPDS